MMNGEQAIGQNILSTKSLMVMNDFGIKIRRRL